MKGIQEYTKEQLIERAAPYFEKYDSMYATSDGNYFYPHAKHYADSHAKEKELQLYLVTRDEFQKNNSKEKELDLFEVTEEQIQDEQQEKKKPGRKPKI